MADEGNRLQCSIPLTGMCNNQDIMKNSLSQMVKVNCSSSTCTESGFVHPECFIKLEDSLIRYVSSINFGTTNTNKKETMRKYNWSDLHDRENLWKNWLYNLVYKKLNCKCGGGYIRKDLSWPPLNWSNQTKKKSKNRSKENSSLPQLNTNSIKGNIRYIAPTTTFVTSYQDSKHQSSIPGAVYSNSGMVKRGIVVSWSKGIGQIKNLNPEEKKICFARDDVLVGDNVTLEKMVGSEVEYQSVKKGKKLEAVYVRLVKSSNKKEGIVTHWVYKEHAGVINADNVEYLACEVDFLPGGFDQSILGKMVEFKTERGYFEAFEIRVVHKSDFDGKGCYYETIPEFNDQDISNCPILEKALVSDENFLSSLCHMDNVSQNDCFSQLKDFIPSLAAHPTGHRVVISMIQSFSKMLKEKILIILISEFHSLSDTAAGAMCLICCASNTSGELLKNLLEPYSTMSSQQAFQHLTGINSFSVYKVLIHLMSSEVIQSWIVILGPVLDSLAGHLSLELLVKQCEAVDHQSLYLLAVKLEASNLLLSNRHLNLVVQLTLTGNVKVCGLLLHNISGKLGTLLGNQYGRKLVTAFISSGSVLQVELIVNELCQEVGGQLPHIVKLAAECGDENFLNVLIHKSRVEALSIVLDIFKQYSETLIASDFGKKWIASISRKVNSLT